MIRWRTAHLNNDAAGAIQEFPFGESEIVQKGGSNVGINDRDYMREETEESSAGLPMVIRMCAVVAAAVIAFIALRAPMPIYGRVVLILFGIVLIRWLFTIPKGIEHDFLLQRGRNLEREGHREAAIRTYEQALELSPKSSGTQLRLLAAYNEALQVNEAKELIKSMDGKTFHENEIEQLEAIISQYRKMSWSKAGSRYRLVLE